MLENPKTEATTQVTDASDATMGNQQVECAYMAGLIDGEGSIALHLKTDNHYAPLVFIGNTNESLVDWIKYFFTKYAISFHLGLGKRYETWHAPVWRFELRKLKYCQRFLRLVEPFLIGKREHARLLLRFLDSRLDENGNARHTVRTAGLGFDYAPWVHDVFMQLKTMNTRGKKPTSTTTRYPRPVGPDDIVCSAARTAVN